MSLDTFGDALATHQFDSSRIGAILKGNGSASGTSIQRALTAQRFSKARIGDILSAHGLVERTDIAEAVVRQHGLPFVDLSIEPADPTLIETADIAIYLDSKIMPWRKTGQGTVYLCSDPDKAATAMAQLRRKDRSRILALTEARSLRSALVTATAGPLAKDRDCNGVDHFLCWLGSFASIKHRCVDLHRGFDHWLEWIALAFFLFVRAV